MQISKLLSGRTVAVVGARGFIGAAVVRALVDAGASVRGVTSLRQRGDEDNLKWVTGNARDQHFLESALDGCDIVINLASNSLPASSNANLQEEIHSHVAWTIKTAEVAFGIGAKRFIFPSSGGTVYGVDCNRPIPEDTPTRPRNAYGVSKLAIEHYLRILHEIGRGEALSLRISNPFGEGQSAKRGQGFIARAMECAFTGEALVVWGDGSAVRDFIYIKDVAKAFVRGCVYAGKRTEINIGSGVGRSLRDVIKSTEEAVNRRIDVRYEIARTIDVSANVLDISTAGEQLGWMPTTGFEQAMNFTAQWWSRHHEKERETARS